MTDITITFSSAQIERLRAARAKMMSDRHLMGQRELSETFAAYCDEQIAVWREVLGDRYEDLAPLLTV